MKVNMLIIGAGRSGTTTLYEYLKTHPDICFSNIKEIPYFSINDIYKRGESYYHSFFKPANQKIIASSDTYLLIDEQAPRRISDYNPKMKIIVMLREPTARSYSSYIYAINNGHEKKTISFIDSFKNENENLKDADIVTKNNLGHFYTGLYYKHIKYWMRFFPKENFLLFKTNELSDDYKKALKKVSDFLNIEEFKHDIEIKTNTASGVKNMFLHRLIINRDSRLRIILSKLFPNFLKKTIFNSGIIDKIKKLNRKKSTYNPISNDEKEFVKKYFENDLQLLGDEFGIRF